MHTPHTHTESIIRSVDEAVPYTLHNYGIALGVAEDTEKYHLFSDIDTTEFIYGAINRQLGRQYLSFEELYEPTEPHGEYREFSWAAEVKSGCRITEALLDPRAVERSEVAAGQLLRQMDLIAADLLPCVRLPASIRESVEAKSPVAAIEHVTDSQQQLFAQVGRLAISTRRIWLQRHISPRSRAFWLDENIFRVLHEDGIDAID